MRTSLDEHQLGQSAAAVCGIDGVRVAISGMGARGVGFGMHAEEVGLFVHGMLRLAGVSVLAEEVDAPRLRVEVVVKQVADLYSVVMSVELWDRVWLTRQTGGEALQAATWRKNGSLVSNRHELRTNIRLELGNLLTGFLNDYVAANQGEGRG